MSAAAAKVATSRLVEALDKLTHSVTALQSSTTERLDAIESKIQGLEARIEHPPERAAAEAETPESEEAQWVRYAEQKRESLDQKRMQERQRLDEQLAGVEDRQDSLRAQLRRWRCVHDALQAKRSSGAVDPVRRDQLAAAMLSLEGDDPQRLMGSWVTGSWPDESGVVAPPLLVEMAEEHGVDTNHPPAALWSMLQDARARHEQLAAERASLDWVT